MADDISLVVGVDYTQLTGLIKTTDQTKRALGSISKEFGKSGNQKQYMRGINQLVAAQKKLPEAARLSRSEIMKLGAQMQQEAKFTQALTNATKGLTNAQMAATKSSNRMGVVTQQAGYQVSDFIVQVQSGTSAFVAFGQQASQLVGVLPLVASPLGLTAGAAVALSAGLGIAIPLVTAIGRAFFETKAAAEQVNDSLEELNSTISSLRGAEKTLEEILEMPLKGANVALKEYLENIKQVKFDDAVKSIRLGFDKAGKAADAEYDRLQKRKDAIYDNVVAQKELLDATESAMKSGQMAYDPSVLSNMRETLAEMRTEAAQSAGLIGAIMHDVREGMLSVGEMTLGENLDEIIDNMVAFKKEMDGSEQLTRLYAEAFDQVAEKLGLTEEVQKRLIQSNKLFIEATELSLNYAEEYQKSLEKQAEEAKEIAEAAKKIKDETQAQVYSLKDKKVLLELEKKYGKDSAELAAEVSFQEELAFKRRMESKGILGNNLKLVMDAYRALQDQKQELEELNKEEQDRQSILKRQVANMKLAYEFMEKQATAAQKLKDAVEAIENNISTQTKSLEDRLLLAETEIQFGKDSVELSRLNAELARKAFIARAMEQGILGDNLKALLTLYDKVAEAEGRVPKGPKRLTPEEELENRRKALQDQLDLEDELQGQTEARRRIIQALGLDYMNVGASTIKSLEDQINKTIELRKENERFAEEVEGPLTDAFGDVADAFGEFIANGLKDFKDFTKSIVASFKQMLAQMISAALRNRIFIPIATGMSAGFGSSAAASTMSSYASGGGGSFLGSMAGTLAGGASAFGSGVMAGIQGFAGGFAGGGGLMGGLSGYGATLSATAANAGIMGTIGAAVPAIAAVALVIGAFSSKTKELDSGLKATIKTNDVLIESYRKMEKSSFFGLSKRKYTTTDIVEGSPVEQQILQLQYGIMSMAKAIGVADDVFNDFLYNFDISLKGLTEDEKLKKINEELGKMGNAFASLIPNVEGLDQLNAIMNERANLEVRLLQAQGDTAALREIELAGTNEYNRALLRQVFAAEDARDAIDDVTNSLQENSFATKLQFERAKAYARLGLDVPANVNSVPMNTSAAPVMSVQRDPSIEQLRREMRSMHEETMIAYSKLIKNTKDNKNILRGWDIVGLPAERSA